MSDIGARINLRIANTYYREYLCHRCLYYKHANPLIGDTRFDEFEKEYALFEEVDLEDNAHLALSMVDWNPNASRTSLMIEKLTA